MALRFDSALIGFALLAVAACGGGDAPACPTFDTNDSCGPLSADERLPFVTPTTIHTGSNGRDTYQAVIVTNIGQITLETNAPDVACAVRFGCIGPSDFGIAGVVTAHAPGNATITLRSGGYSERISVIVTDYSTDEYALGDERYNSPANVNDTDRVACADCHSGQGGAPHSPVSLAEFSDEALLAAVEASQYPGICEDEDSGDTCDCTPSGTDCSGCPGSCIFNEGAILSLEVFGGGPGEHVYDLTADERVAVMAYMRAIRPEGI